MIITGVRETSTHWELSGPVGDTLRLPKLTSADREILIGTAGTRRAVKVPSPFTERFAEMLADLQRPIMLVDVRRTGMGGSGSWGPEEFATTIPGLLRDAGVNDYSFHHMPVLAPRRELLDQWKQAVKVPESLSEDQIDAAATAVMNGAPPDSPAAWKYWQVFRAAYRRQLSQGPAIPAARAFVEAANERGGIGIFLCAEERRDDFDSAGQEEQDNCYCHRFALTAIVATAFRDAFPDAELIRVDLGVCQPARRVRLFPPHE